MHLAQVECLKRFNVRGEKGGRQVTVMSDTETDTEMQTCNLVTEQWSEQFMAGY